MIDKLLHDLIEKKWKADTIAIGFLDILLMACAVVFSMVIRTCFRGFSIGSYKKEIAPSDIVVAYMNKISTIEIGLILVLAILAALFVYSVTKSVTRAGLLFTVILFVPSFIVDAQMMGQLNIVPVILLFLAVILAYKKKWHLAPVPVILCAIAAWLVPLFYMRVDTAANLYKIIGYGPFMEEYKKAGIGLWIFILLSLFYVAKGRIKAEQSLLVTEFLLVAAILLLERVPVSFLLLADFLAVVGVFLYTDHTAKTILRAVFRAVLVISASFAAQYMRMLEKTYIPMYVYSFLLLYVLLDLSLELYDGFSGANTKAPLIKASNKENKKKIGALEIELEDALYLICVLTLAFLLRYIFRGFESVDYKFCLQPWILQFKKLGFSAIAGDFYNYPPFYMIQAYIVSLFHGQPLYPLKVLSGIWDVILAIFASLSIYELTKNKKKMFLCFGMILCLPTVAANSGLWAQCDVMYVSMVIGSLYMYIKEKPNASMLLLGVAFSFKMQIFFVLPVYVYLWVRRKYKIGQFLYLPGVYILSCIPSVLGGKSFKDLLLLYVGQSQQEPWMMSWYWPNIYSLFGPHEFYQYFATAGMYGAIAVTMILLYYMAKKLTDASGEMVILMMQCYALLIPFFLPYMHERYGYIAEVMTVMVFLLWPKKIVQPLLMMVLSYAAYVSHLHEECIVPTQAYCFAMLFLLLVSIYQVFAYEKGSRFFINN